ncbi:hypothetical protein CI109_106400 [Kwoniella shandongensis]|uniref:Phospholipid-transporting ATPase n=1 Tax=Kwoniella shandongensis TaxID=1734106 RepID=A0A5M6BS44_9TREE|nr:uncharacterized protein CI109_005891 [Kwoniella shandongensis]KAA5525728.1 hypothetical protein CI109_005891 [Kwoniella shandongensis]
MAAASSKQPLVPRSKKHQPSWFQRNVSRPIGALAPSRLFAKKKRPAVARSIYINEPIPEDFFDKKGRILKDHTYPSNQNVTSKYTIITFLPRNLAEQFRRVANVFFLAINILQFFPKFSTISPGLVILPLIIVLLITALKDGYEDIKRHQADHRTNHAIVHVLGGPGYENNNPMSAKDKTFVPGIPLPKRLSKKAKKGKAGTTDLLEQERAAEPAPGPEPRGNGGLSRVRSQISNWEDDPEAGDTPGELGWHRTIWEDVKVGDIVKIYDNEQFPADIVICSTSEEEDVAYIETKNLDGETNLKSRNGIPGLSHLDSAEACAKAKLRVDLEAPEVNMFRLNGAVSLLGEDQDDEHAVHPITLETTLLRGCVLKNTAWVIGIVIFTGADTKIIQNAGATPSKRSKVERQMNPQVLINLLILALIAMVCAIIDHFNEVGWTDEGAYWMLYNDTSGDNPRINGLVTFANAFITFQNIVPISLYISIEAVRTIQAAFIYWDRSIKYVKDGVTTRTTARSWNLSDDLGQIEYVFSDKTGTLTQNAMIFRQCSVGGKIYVGDDLPPSHPTIAHAHGHKNSANKPPSDTSDSEASAQTPKPDGDAEKVDDVKVALPKEVLASFHSTELDHDLESHDTEQSRILHGFFAVLGLCHTVLAAEPEPGVIEYKAQSPDEAALVQSAADVGFVFRGRDHNVLKMSTPFSEEPDEYELLHVLEFNSSRKRMSVILKKLDEDGRIFLLCKGADNVIFERLVKDNSQKELRQKTDADLQYFASEGLRTLCLAYKVLDAQVYEDWARDYHNATVSLHEREEKVEEVSSRIENDLILLGATAIEDKLQDGVPETISDLKRAGIKVWVATGDKLETAVAIGYTTNLLTKDTNLIVVREGNHSIEDQLRDALEGFFGDDEGVGRTISRITSRMSGEAPRLARVNTGVQSLVGRDNGTRPGGFSLVIDGHALAHCFDDEDIEALLLALSTRCNTVVCCRVSPLQKAQIVHLIKDNLGVMCLAIGDGANDVSMIQAADVGIGISGEEGLQAVNSADYGIAQFRYLKRLLFVHGHWSYYRNSNMILNFFYKNIIGIGVLFWFMIYCGWSTTYVFAYVYLLFWNVFWTIAPVIAIGLFDRNIDDEALMALPELYRRAREGKYFGLKPFFYYIMEGWYQAAVIYFFIHYAYVTTSARGDGYDVYMYEMSTTQVIGAVMVANLFSGLNIEAWTGWVWFAVWVGPFLVWVFTAIYSIIPPSSFYTGVYGNDVFLFRSAAYWFGWPFVVVVALLPRYLIKTFKQNIVPNDVDTMRLVRKYQPDVNMYTHPMLGGKLQEKKGQPESDDEEEYDEGRGHDEGIRLVPVGGETPDHQAFGKGDRHGDLEGGVPQGQGQRQVSAQRLRRSMESSRSRFGYNHSARGSAVDMSTGLEQAPSRGYDFTMEEGGVAIQRMQSRLSQTSSHRMRGPRWSNPVGSKGSRGNNAGNGVSPANPPFGKPSTPIGRIRERAGSILSRKRASTDATQGSSGDGSGVHEGSPHKSGGFLSPLRKKSTAQPAPSSGLAGAELERERWNDQEDGDGEVPALGRPLGRGRVTGSPEPRV